MTRSIRSLIASVADIGTAVRASREFSRLSAEGEQKAVDQRTICAFLPN